LQIMENVRHTHAESKRIYNDFVPAYDAGYAYHREDVDVFMSLAHLTAGQSVLDMGCGSGFVAMAALDAVGTSGHVVALDCAAKLLARGWARLKEQGRAGQISWLEWDMGNAVEMRHLMPPAGANDWEGFDVIFSLWAWSHVPLAEQMDMLDQWREHLLAPGGRIIVDWAPTMMVGAALDLYTAAGQRQGRYRLVTEAEQRRCEGK
jgi:SAM-dependent methyltransferase